MKNDLDKNRIRINQLLWLSIVSIWIFYMWILSETPYEIDDWSWGISEGWHALVTGELNGRYLSNLLEVIVSRSPLMIIGVFSRDSPTRTVYSSFLKVLRVITSIG